MQNNKDQQLIEAITKRENKVKTVALSQSDWLHCALTLFLNEGIEAVQITRLAKELKMTRGSFYWHYKSKDELLKDIITFWTLKNPHGLMHALDSCETIDEGVLALFSCWLDPTQFDPKLDLCIRDWGRTSPVVNAVIKENDLQCIQAISDFFHRMGIVKDEALSRARNTYFCQVGYHTLNLDESLELRLLHLQTTIYMLTGVKPEARRVEKFLRQFL